MYSRETEELEATDQKLLSICTGRSGDSYEHMKVHRQTQFETDFPEISEWMTVIVPFGRCMPRNGGEKRCLYHRAEIVRLSTVTISFMHILESFTHTDRGCLGRTTFWFSSASSGRGRTVSGPPSRVS